MLIVDEAVIPAKALFDYSMTTTQPHSLTVDGALDGISHALEVLMGIPEAQLKKAVPVCLTGIELIVNNIKKVVSDPKDIQAREAIGLGTDLGGYSIMIGGTNGAHLNSFSLTDILSHGRALRPDEPLLCCIFLDRNWQPAREIGKIYQKAGYLSEDLDQLEGRKLGLAIAKGMIRLSEDIVSQPH